MRMGKRLEKILEKMTLKQLRGIARDYKIPGRADLNKGQLIELIKNADLKESEKLSEKIPKPKKQSDVSRAEDLIYAALRGGDRTLAQLQEVIPLSIHSINKALANLRVKGVIDFVIIERKRLKIPAKSLVMVKPPRVRRYFLNK